MGGTCAVEMGDTTLWEQINIGDASPYVTLPSQLVIGNSFPWIVDPRMQPTGWRTVDVVIEDLQ
jgi:hypothetical protein